MKGQKINDRYQIIKSIGEGGMANVYLAYDTILDRDVAVKILRGDLSNDDKFVRRFQREALNASSLSHPNIVEVYDVGDDNGQYFIVMEYIEGKNLKDLLKKRGKLTVTEVIDIMGQIADGLSVAHDSYIIHRDIKPQNIMILENGLVKITDFGIAMAMNATQLTQTNSVMGSVHYLPPEQASGKGSTLKSDIYSMGILMYELLTGTLPYRGDNAVEIALKHLKEPLPSIREEIPEVPQSVENIILRSAAKNPKNRYNDARGMYEDLKTCMDDARINEEKYVYPFPELDGDNKKFTKQVEKAIHTEEEHSEGKKDDEILVKKITNEEIKKENRILVVLSAIFVGLIVIVAAFVLFISFGFNTKDITVPDLSGKMVSDAISELQDLGFEVSDQQEEISSEDVAIGNVVKTNPAAGSKRSKGTVVTLYISKGDTKIEIEDYTGKKYEEVQQLLRDYGLYVLIEFREIDEKDSNSIQNGVILEQDISAGTKLSLKDTITFTVSKIVTAYPDFTDGTYTVEEVQAFCEKYDIDLSIEYVTGTSYNENHIFQQSRAPGTTILTDGKSKLTIRVASVGEGNGEDDTPSCEEMGLC